MFDFDWRYQDSLKRYDFLFCSVVLRVQDDSSKDQTRRKSLRGNWSTRMEIFANTFKGKVSMHDGWGDQWRPSSHHRTFFFLGGGPLRHILHIAWTTVNKNLPYGGRESERASHIRVAKMRMETAGKCHDQSTRETWEFSGLKRQDSQKSAPPVTPLPPQPSHLVILFSEGTKEITL